MGLIFIFFLILTITILLGSHAFIYFSLRKFFSLQDSKFKIVLIALLIFLSVGYITSTLLLHWHQAEWLKNFYFFISFWLGIVINLVLFFNVFWVMAAILKFYKVKLDYNLLGIIFFMGALAWSVYGVINARIIKTTSISVPIKSLPEEWKDIKAVQLSDVHLGAILDNNFLEKVVAETNRLQPDIIFITGDLFDGTCKDFDKLIAPIDKLTAPLGIYYVSGNHETYAGLEQVEAAIKKTKLRFMHDEIIEIKGMQLVGVDYPSRGLTKDITPTLAKLNSGKPGILLYHEPVNTKIAKEKGINLQLAGHTHKGQLFPVNFVTHLIYKGLDYGLHTEEDYSIYTTNGVGAWGTPMRTLNRPEIVEIKFE